MEKKDLKTGMRAELRDGNICIIIQVDRKFHIVRKGWGTCLSNYTDNLCRNNTFRNDDIMKIYEGFQYDKFLSHDNGPLVWERNEEPTIEITVKINGKESKLSDISKETLLQIRKDN